MFRYFVRWAGRGQALPTALISQQGLQLFLRLFAERDQRLLLIAQLQCIAVAGELNDSLDVLQIYEIGAVRFEEAASGQF